VIFAILFSLCVLFIVSVAYFSFNSILDSLITHFFLLLPLNHTVANCMVGLFSKACEKFHAELEFVCFGFSQSQTLKLNHSVLVELSQAHLTSFLGACCLH
jgi:hypothetical protein